MIKFYVEIDLENGVEEKVNFATATEVEIFDNVAYQGDRKDLYKMLNQTQFIFDIYLKADELIDIYMLTEFVLEHWNEKEFHEMSRSDLLDEFYKMYY